MDADETFRWWYYRRAYGLTCQRLDMVHSLGPDGRDHEARVARLHRDVAREMGERAGPALEAVRQGIVDAAEGRTPAW